MNKDQKRVTLQAILFLTTFLTTTLAGSFFMLGKAPLLTEFTWSDFYAGLEYSVPFLLILTVHEFGHYLTARYYKVDVTLPYYIPIPPIISFGTMGALIRIKSRIPSNKINFDIGIAGPLAGFVMALIVLGYGFTHLPPPEHIFTIHPEYQQYGLDYAQHVYQSTEVSIGIETVGNNLLFMFFENFVGDPSRIPNHHEVIHYPYLFAGYLSLVFTCINLLPIGQLDGGHVLHGLIGYKRHKIVASVFFIALIFYSGLGLVHPGLPMDDLMLYVPLYLWFLYLVLQGLKWPKRDTLMVACLIFAIQFVIVWQFPTAMGYSGWLLFTFLIGRFVGVAHPPAPIELPLDTGRKILGWIALAIFVLCFSPNPF